MGNFEEKFQSSFRKKGRENVEITETGDEQRIQKLGDYADERGDDKTQKHELSGMARR